MQVDWKSPSSHVTLVECDGSYQHHPLLKIDQFNIILMIFPLRNLTSLVCIPLDQCDGYDVVVSHSSRWKQFEYKATQN